MRQDDHFFDEVCECGCRYFRHDTVDYCRTEKRRCRDCLCQDFQKKDVAPELLRLLRLRQLTETLLGLCAGDEVFAVKRNAIGNIALVDRLGRYAGYVDLRSGEADIIKEQDRGENKRR